jgi:seryl-tRNA synthetase
MLAPERSGQVSGPGFPLLIGPGARLVRALVDLMLDLHTGEHGYTEVHPPLLCRASSLEMTGQLPAMERGMYHLASDDLYMIPSPEVPLTGIFRDEIIEQPLPVCLVAAVPCFRREAGAPGRAARGLIRTHQFQTVHLVRIVTPDESSAELDILLSHAEKVLLRLGLTYRVMEVCTGNLSFAAARSFRLELWCPGRQAWLAVSTCSNFGDFQARRARVRYRDELGRVRFVHTLNGAGVALGRLMVAVIENCQQQDGSVRLPEAVAGRMGGTRIISPE